MRYDEMLARVREELGLPDQEHADKAIRATVQVLGERLSGQEPANLRDQLPAELATELPTTGDGQSFDADEFIRRVGEREGLGCSQDQLRQHAQTALTVVLGSVSGEERDDVLAQLPQDVRALAGAR